LDWIWGWGGGGRRVEYGIRLVVLRARVSS
jgi:hypothetical protein